MELRAGYKQTEVGVIPWDWRLLELNNLVENGKIPSGIFKEQIYYGTGVQIIKLGDVINYDFFIDIFLCKGN